MQPTKDDVARQFGRRSHAYASSAGHASGSDLAMLVAMLDLKPHMNVLDVATGAGHTAAAVAPHVRSVMAIDLAPEMIERVVDLAIARGLHNVQAKVMDCETLDFPDESFDAVTCRIAPHHFLDLELAIQEIARVLRPRGQFGLEDSCAPDDPILDNFINTVEKLRDATHVRSHTEQEWTGMLERAGLEVLHTSLYRKRHVMEDWVERAGIDQKTADQVYEAFVTAPEEAKAYFELEYLDGRAISFTDEKLLVQADKKRDVQVSVSCG